MAYMIRLEKKGQPRQLIMVILDRGDLYSQDTSTRICPKAMDLKNGETTFFFNRFEQPIQVTIIDRRTPAST